MNEGIYVEKLSWFKANEKPEAVLLVADDPARIKIAVAWTNLEVRRAKKLTEFGGKGESDTWEWLWENARYSATELADRIGIPYSRSTLESKMKPLIGNRALYPDGTVNSFVQRYLREQVLELFEAKPSRFRRKGQTGRG
jgi:hypothetical protein